MTKIYCVNGKLLDIVKREAKTFKQKHGVKLGEAQAETAKGYGPKSWQELTETTVTVEEDFAENLTLLSRNGIDEARYCVATLEEMLDEGLFDTGEVPQLFYRIELLCGFEPGTVSREIEIINYDEAVDRGIPLPFMRKGQNGAEDFITAIEAVADGQPGLLIGLLHQEGLFDLSFEGGLAEAEFEALLTLQLRTHNYVLGERLLFNAANSPKIDEVLDWTRRLFVHDLGDDLVIISNGAGSTKDLRSTIMPKSRLDALVAEMVDELGDAAYTTQRGELWIHDRVLGAAPVDESVPEDMSATMH